MLADYDGMVVNIEMKTDLLFFVMANVTLNCVYFYLSDFLVAREPWRQSTSWGDMVEEEPARPPGHGIHMHEKLSSPSRKRCKTYCVCSIVVEHICLFSASCANQQNVTHFSCTFICC